MSVATLDFERFARRGYPEAVLSQGKSVAQMTEIVTSWRARADEQPLGTLLLTRVSPEQVAAVHAVLPDAFYDETSALMAWPPEQPEPTGGKVVVVCAGTSDLRVAREATLTARYLGRDVTEVVDVGVAGLDRILAKRDVLRSADVVVAVAGMDAAIVPVVAGLVACPVVAVPTSVGYGTAFEGVAALLSMLNSCSPGVGVVNIDNGYGAGHLAAQISAPKEYGDA